MSDWTEIGNSGESTTWDKTGTLIGTYKRMKTNVGPNESNVYELETTDKETGEVSTYSIWGSSVINSKFEQIEVGSMVRIEALGTATSPKTGRTYNDFKVSVKPVADSVKQVFPDAEQVA